MIIFWQFKTEIKINKLPLFRRHINKKNQYKFVNNYKI